MSRPEDSFQYVVLRVVPRIERGERINGGIVVYAQANEFLQARVALDETRLHAIAPGVETGPIKAQLDAIAAVAAGNASAGPIARLDRGQRFHWLSSPASTVVQPGPIHTGLCSDPAEALERLFARLVLPAPDDQAGGDR
ncbi:MAG: hypothetical protein QOJ13_3184 [Gaiellales bacterium]|nr:hypothetical protein [Gaiellales bacterium]